MRAARKYGEELKIDADSTQELCCDFVELSECFVINKKFGKVPSL